MEVKDENTEARRQEMLHGTNKESRESSPTASRISAKSEMFISAASIRFII